MELRETDPAGQPRPAFFSLAAGDLSGPPTGRLFVRASE